MLQSLRYFSILLALGGASATRAQATSDLASFPELEGWLQEHPAYHRLTDKDCRCEDDLAEIRSESGPSRRPDYHPYYAAGDFNKDGRFDVAIGVARNGDSDRFRVLIINSVNKRQSRRHAYLSPYFPAHYYLFYGAPAAGDRLLVGPYASDTGAALVPRGPYRYSLEYEDF